MRVEDGDKIKIDGLCLDAIHIPGHTSDAYCFYTPGMVFTGDTLFIRGTGRTDFHGGNALDAYGSLFNKLLKLPEHTLVYPGHDNKGDSCSTIGEERAFNPRLQVKSASEYAKIMDNLILPTPKMMDIVIPKNQTWRTTRNASKTIGPTTYALCA
jgi:sulfur dioxygenase